jgi:hypothetical protein
LQDSTDRISCHIIEHMFASTNRPPPDTHMSAARTRVAMVEVSNAARRDSEFVDA